jgi:hypothetical protein
MDGSPRVTIEASARAIAAASASHALPALDVSARRLMLRPAA